MSYLVLARKWRPRNFHTVVGQGSVLKALINALDTQRLHQAYLFTGTRGIGKTTLARILAKCLNCEQGISSSPCEQCANCLAIAQGNFPDLIEIDAASRTKVEDTRELLENVPYLPSQGRFKVYLIDEVHMLSTHSFNALLKTLEEPPAHVKFIFATTDPQKLPATILSRCLQFHLRRLSIPEIVGQLEKVLLEENIAFEGSALKELALSAEGSMRDALTLLEQAIAHGESEICLDAVLLMLGRCDARALIKVLQAIVEGDAKDLLQQLASLCAWVPDFSSLLQEILQLLHQLAVLQLVPDALSSDTPYQDELQALAQGTRPEDIQLYYQIALQGLQDLPYMPNVKTGIEMVLLRMLAFHPARVWTEDRAVAPKIGSKNPLPLSNEPKLPFKTDMNKTEIAEKPVQSITRVTSAKFVENSTLKLPADPKVEPGQANTTAAFALQLPPSQPIASVLPLKVEMALIKEEPKNLEASQTNDGELPQDWSDLLPKLGLKGVSKLVAEYCTVLSWHPAAITLLLDEAQKPLWNKRHEDRLQEALSQYFKKELRVKIQIGKVQQETPAFQNQRLQKEVQEAADQVIADNPIVRRLMQGLDAELEQVVPVSS